MTTSIRVRPARPDLHVPNPERRRLLLPEGELVPDVPYWRRRIAAGEVVVLEDLAPAAEAARAPKTRKE